MVSVTQAKSPFVRELEKAGCFRGLFGGSGENSGKILGNCWNIISRIEMIQILWFRAPGKANLPGTLGRHCLDLVPTFRARCFIKSTVPAFSSFFWICQKHHLDNLENRADAKGVILSEQACFMPSKCLLDGPFLEPLLKTLLRTLRPSLPLKSTGRHPFLETSRKQSPEPSKSLS